MKPGSGEETDADFVVEQFSLKTRGCLRFNHGTSIIPMQEGIICFLGGPEIKGLMLIRFDVVLVEIPGERESHLKLP